MNACSTACGFCGACTDSFEGDPAHEPFLFCDRRGCGNDVVHPISLAGLGVFCSRACASIEEAAFTEHMKRAGWQVR